MAARTRSGSYYRFAAWLVVVVLVNVAGLTLFFRVDMTKGGVYSLSRASRETVANLSEPLTINVFFTKNLPAPHNNTERYLRDLLEEYAVHANRYFNFRFYDVSPEEGDLGETAMRNRELARDYGIFPVQVQHIEHDEVKFKRAYMGIVFVHGDVVDKIPAVTSTDGLEYTITSKIERMSNKIRALVDMDEPVSVTLAYTPALAAIAPHVRMQGLAEIPERVEEIVSELGGKYYGRLAYATVDPVADSLAVERYRAYNIVTLRWQAIRDRSGNELAPPGQGAASLLVEKGGRFRTIPLIEVFSVPLFGTQYQLADMGTLGERLGEAIDGVLDINKKLGYLADRGTPPLHGSAGLPGQPQAGAEGLTNFNRVVSENYSLSEVRIAEDGIPDDIDCLIIAGPRERFSDWDLFQIDQFLMRGKSLAVFYDAFDELNLPQAQRGHQQGPVFVPVETGLEQLLEHYGVSIERSYVLDVHCYEQQLPRMYGGGVQPIYFAPIIKKEKINDKLPFMKHVRALVTVKSAPVRLRTEALSASGLAGEVVFSSSDESWKMSGRIDLSPWAMQPPEDPSAMQSFPLAAVLSGPFPSWFAGRPVPERPLPEDEADADGEPAAERAADAVSDVISDAGAVIERGSPGRLFLIGSSEVLRNNVIDEEGAGISAVFVMNVLDHLNGRDAHAEMRGKTQRFNPLRETAPGVRTLVKTLNIAGLPVLVVAFGAVVWALRARRKRAIRMMFGA